MSDALVYLAEGARSELSVLASVLERAGLQHHIGPPPADCLAPG